MRYLSSCRRKFATSAGVMGDVAAKGLCQFSRRTAASLKPLGILHSSGRKNVQGNRGPACAASAAPERECVASS
jgi:hypothetical protein